MPSGPEAIDFRRFGSQRNRTHPDRPDSFYSFVGGFLVLTRLDAAHPNEPKGTEDITDVACDDRVGGCGWLGPGMSRRRSLA